MSIAAIAIFSSEIIFHLIGKKLNSIWKISRIVLVVSILRITTGHAQFWPLSPLYLQSSYLNYLPANYRVAHLAENPAALAENLHVSLFKFTSLTEAGKGEFRRAMDPASKLSVYGIVESVYPFADSLSIFHGYFQYYTENLNNLQSGLEYEPYKNIFTAIDTTSGTFDYYGPIAGFEYARKSLPWLSWGLQIDYGLQLGLKREYSKTKVNGRFLSAVLGTELSLSTTTKIGVAFSPFNHLYRLNAGKKYLLDYPLIYRFYGDSLIVRNENIHYFDRKLLRQGYWLSIDGSFSIGNCLFLKSRVGKSLDHHQIAENISEGKLPKDDFGSFQQTASYFVLDPVLRIEDFPVQIQSSLLFQKC